MQTLVVDDEEKIRLFLTEILEGEGHTVTALDSGEKALDLLQDTGFDLAILDLKLGGLIDGQRVLEAIRWRWPATVVIMLTAFGSLDSAVDAIQEGVDGYLLKPVRPTKIRSAIDEAIYRRRKLLESEQQRQKGQLLERGPFTIDLETHQVYYEGDDIELSPREFVLLTHLMQKAPQVVDPKELVQIVRNFEPEYMNEARDIIKWYIHRLRNKIEPDPSNPRFVLNVRGVGYRFNS
jgi:DNA-binding response OmpR family regulator